MSENEKEGKREIRAELVRNTKTQHENYIKTTFPDGNTDSILEGEIQNGPAMDRLSDNELRKVHSDCYKQIERENPLNVPLVFYEMMELLEQVLESRDIEPANPIIKIQRF